MFGLSVCKFVQCTEESREKDPAVVMRNMRQFMSGMKNYLVRNGEGELQNIIDEERSKVRVGILLMFREKKRTSATESLL